ncbi:MAG: hypothetical protein M1820_001071 [Bogoriella megaspora]|nr:MAG: hypothetical protein M1820_001071 [Bogoriella megaspora]
MLSYSAAQRSHRREVVASTVHIAQSQQVLAFQSAQSSFNYAIRHILLLLQYMLFTALSSFLLGVRLLWKKTEHHRDRWAEQFVRNLMSPSAILIFVFWPGWLVIGAICLVFKIIG